MLLVDDDAAVRRAVARLLEGSDLHVVEAEGPEDAVRLAERHEGDIDLVLSDVAMAGLDGIRLVERLRSRRPGTRALLMSGYTQEAISRLGKPALPYPLLVKPFTKASLLEAIRLALANGVPDPSRTQPSGS